MRCSLLRYCLRVITPPPRIAMTLSFINAATLYRHRIRRHAPDMIYAITPRQYSKYLFTMPNMRVAERAYADKH